MMTAVMLVHLIEDVLQLCCYDCEEEEEGDSYSIYDMLDALRKNEVVDLYKEEDEPFIRENALKALQLYEIIEEKLFAAQQGIIAKDQKMLAVLRQMRGNLKKHFLQSTLLNKKSQQEKKARLSQHVSEQYVKSRQPSRER